MFNISRVALRREQGEPLSITQNGKAKVVVQDIDSYEQMQETLALLKILALGNREVEAGRTRPAADVIAELRRLPLPD